MMVVTGLLRGEWRAAFAGIAVAAMLVAATSAAAQAQAPAPAPGPPQTTVERNAKGVAGKPIQVGIYLNVQPDCSSGPLPAIRLVSPPGNGTVTIKRGKVSATNYKQCLALEVPGFIAFYQSKADFAGTDTVTLEVKFPQGRTEVQRIMINVGVGPAGQKI
nr:MULTISPECIES: hypothetical protein [unclassified Bradyrhizobium]